MRARYASTCGACGDPIEPGVQITNDGEGWVHSGCRQLRDNLRDPEYARGYHDTRHAQMAGPPGSAAREAAYAAMEAQWAREGFDY